MLDPLHKLQADAAADPDDPAAQLMADAAAARAGHRPEPDYAAIASQATAQAAMTGEDLWRMVEQHRRQPRLDGQRQRRWRSRDAGR